MVLDRYRPSVYLVGAAVARTADEMSAPALLLLGLAVAGSARTASLLYAGLTISAAAGGPPLGVLLDRAARPGVLLAVTLGGYAAGLAVVTLSLGHVPVMLAIAQRRSSWRGPGRHARPSLNHHRAVGGRRPGRCNRRLPGHNQKPATTARWEIQTAGTRPEPRGMFNEQRGPGHRRRYRGQAQGFSWARFGRLTPTADTGGSPSTGPAFASRRYSQPSRSATPGRS